MHKSEHNNFLWSVFIFFAGIIFLGFQIFSGTADALYTASAETSVETAQKNIEQPVQKSQPVVATPVVADPVVQTLQVQAESALSLEVNPTGYQKAIFSKNDEQQLPIASLTKLMTALVVLENYNLDQQVVISPSAMAEEGEQGSLKLGETLTVKNLLYISLIESSNRAAKALSEVMGTERFIDLMNKNAVRLEMLHTHFDDVTGLSDRSYSTVKDLAALSQYLFYHYPLFSEIASLQQYDLYLSDDTLHHTLTSTNKLLGEFPNIVGGKTGFTESALGCFMVMQRNPRNGNYFLHIILGSNDRFGEMKKMMYWANVNNT